MKEIKFDSAKEVVVIEAETKTVSAVNAIEIKDNFKSVIAVISFDAIGARTKEIILWEGEDYTKIGNWTDEDVQKRILELI